MKSSWPLTSANHFLRQQQDALNAQLAALFQDDSGVIKRDSYLL